MIFLSGKTTFFVINQANLEVISPEQLSVLEADLKAVEEENGALTANVKELSSGAQNNHQPTLTCS